jgi:hypothetical protein
MNITLKCIHLTEDSEKTYTVDIYRDDTIDNVKSKLSQVDEKNVDEYYFFAKQWVQINPYEQYKKFSHDNTRTITYEMFAAFCLNHDFPVPDKKSSYELTDFLELPEESYESFAIGIVNGSSFVVNPFKNPFPQQEDSGTSSKMLWMSLPETIYVCFSEDVNRYSKKEGLELSKVFNVYYPYLFKEGRFEPLNGMETKTDYREYNRMIDFHHRVYNPQFILSEGISSIYFVMYTLQPFSFPLDIFFKLFPSSKQNPYIKLNGHKTHENIYRLYCNQQSENGFKIPLLKKKTILKYAHDINKNSISYLFYARDIPVFLNINKKGHLYFRIDQIPSLSIETIEEMVKTTVQSFLYKLIEYFDPSQKIFTTFEHFHQPNLSILDMKYKCNFKKEGKMNIQKNMTCFSPIFNYMNEKERVQLRYKRVSNYNESQSKDAYLIEAFNQAVPIEEMISLFSANFMKHNDKAAADYVHQFFSTIEIEEKQNNLRRVKINPGFLVEIEKKENIEVTVHSIDHIQYLPFIRLYVTNLILISQGIVSDEGMCKTIKEIEVKEIAPVKPLIETNFTMNEEFFRMEDPDENDNLSEPLPNNSPLESPEPNDLDPLNNSPLESPEDEPKEPEPKQSVDLNNSPLESPEKQPDLGLNESPLESPDPEPKEIEPKEIEPTDLDLDLNESPESSLESPENDLKGGSISETRYEVFIYDENDPFTIQKRFKKNPIREGKLEDYFRVFQGSECTLVKKEGETCKGYIVELTDQELTELRRDATILRIDYFDKPGNPYEGITYIHEPKNWENHPSIQFVKKVYATVSYGWKHKQDKQDEMYIYDKDNQLKARYNGKYYVKLDEDEELTKIQFTPVNPLLQRLQEREPLLFTKSDKNHTQYSRMCLWSDKRQPVILSKEEKERIDEIAPGSYESAIEYSTDPKNPYYYICPRYWDLKHQLPVHPDKVDPDKLISRNASDSDKQKNIQSRYILELAKPGDTPIYQTRPGFLTKKHPNGYYMPCCFISKPKKDKPDAIDKRIQEASQSIQRESGTVRESLRESEKGSEKEKTKDYIQNGDKFPLPENRKGHLTPILEKFFQVNYSDCYSQIQKRKLKVNYPCLLRHGVDESHSFLSSLSFLYYKKSAPLSTFLNVLLEKITLDTILTFHNGGIVDTFAKDYEGQVITEEHKKSKLYRTMTNEESFKRVVNGYEHFVRYLKSNEYIDYTYLWDVVTQALFKEKVNLVVLKEGLEDVTHNLHIVCPTTAHAMYLFTDDHPSLILYQKGDLFEPLYIYKKMSDGKDKTITLFDDSENIPTVHAILKRMNDTIGESCKEKTIHKTYAFKENLYLHELLDELKKIDYPLKKEVMNIDGRIFGVMVGVKPFFLPCKPSAVMGDFIFVDEVNWLDYRNTVKELKQISELSQQRIPCNPVIRLLENELIVGILTETNQFVPLKEPEENKVRDSLKILDEKNPRLLNDSIQSGILNPKELVIQHLKLEQMFYNAFFNTIKVELNDSKHLMIRKQIEQSIQTQDSKKLEQLFEPIFQDKFLFVEDYAVDLNDVQHINLCKNRDEPYCGTLEHEGKLLIPLYNLFNQSNNEVSYKNRFIDDLAMNVHIQRMLLEDIHSTLYYTDRYQLTDHEILLLESDLNTYLDKEPVKKITSVIHSMLEDVQPSKLIEVAEKIEPVAEDEKIYLNKDEMDIPDEPEELEPKEMEPKELEEPVSDPPEVHEVNLDLMNGNIPVESFPVPIEEPDTEPESEPEPVAEPVTKHVTEPVKISRPKPVRKSRKLKPVQESLSLNTTETIPEIVPVKTARPKPVRSSKSRKVLGTSMDDVSVAQLPKFIPEPTPKEIESLSLKIKQNEEKKNVEKAEEYVKSAKELYQRAKTNATENVVLLAQEQLKEIQPSLPTKIKRIEPDLIPCIKTFYFKANSKWKDYFPPKTIGFRIMKGDTYKDSVIDLTCNFIMALQILKSYNPKYSALTIRDLKEMLIQSYTHLSETIVDLNKKFRKEKKRFTSWSEIMMESYPFTQIDLLVLMIEYKLPVVIFIQAKNKIKLITYHTDDTFKYYIKMKKKDVFMFFIANHDFRIERRDMGALYHTERDIVYLNDPASLTEFMDHYS